ncbi:uncharacterized protein CELE_C56E6.7 [Caenorhabditis elegans]|uniref:Secreted protein n=1 Tax=Caenorhabditis elegans TaxID=6239 RepID=Q5WRT3_CAEEL|nr:Secreted protein [Caenorhabditis elegans]CCD68205.1 Secreted protein [Caenorhabditis elegans]|eukprot:NP_001022044.1 Uncharacterized protein CELE_C56E6.7 [Caenorhabditis elegans]
MRNLQTRTLLDVCQRSLAVTYGLVWSKLSDNNSREKNREGGSVEDSGKPLRAVACPIKVRLNNRCPSSSTSAPFVRLSVRQTSPAAASSFSRN